jgi:hypothetical protein
LPHFYPVPSASKGLAIERHYPKSERIGPARNDKTLAGIGFAIGTGLAVELIGNAIWRSNNVALAQWNDAVAENAAF